MVMFALLWIGSVTAILFLLDVLAVALVHGAKKHDS